MDAASRHSGSPDDCSDGNDTMSAPSEFLAEFLSVIMRRQYAEALKYCRLILQYEPHNATARGFLPLLQHKVQHRRPRPRSSSSEDASPTPAAAALSRGSPSRSCGSPSPSPSCGSQSSLELDSSEAAPSSSASGGGSSGAASRSPTDGNGNATATLRPDDVANDNAGASLRRLRAHFACSR